jgi:AraC family transcriptional regulator
MEIHTVEIEPLHVRGLEHKGPYQSIGQTFDRLSEHQDSLGPKSAPLVAIYYDDPHEIPAENLRAVAGVIVQGESKTEDQEVKDVKIPGGRYAMASFVGDYSKLGKAWEEFYGSVFGSGLKTKADLCFERYINTPADTAPTELITELYAPLA